MTRTSGQLHAVNTATARFLQVGGKRMLSGIGKQAQTGAIPVGRLGLAGDVQADLSIHGGLNKAVYAYPLAHYAYWQTRRRALGISLFDAPLDGSPGEPLSPGFVGENLTLTGLLESQVWIGDELHFPHCVLRVTEPRQPCGKFNAVMGYAHAARDMALQGCCGFYMAVDAPGTLSAGETFTLVPGRRALSVADAFAAKRGKHWRS